MQVICTEIPDVKRLSLSAFEDKRGRFLRVFDAGVYAELGLGGPFVQENVSTSGPRVLRGLHFQREAPQGKLVSVLAGAVADVAVDLRIASPTFGRWVRVDLDARVPEQVWVPPGFAHGFCVLRAPAIVMYRTTTAYDPDDQWGLSWNDPDLGIEWPLLETVLSARDRALPTLAQIKNQGLLGLR
jgi:dTDP-4-dehydrorhamnose 3,5-epimerase